MLRVEHLNWKYSAENPPALYDCSLALQPGKLLGILGPNGSGKSTLLKLMSGVLRAPKGCVFLFDEDLAGFSSRKRARHIALVPQRAQLEFGFTAREVVAMGRLSHPGKGRSPEDAHIVTESLRAVKALPLADRVATTFSGGEWQRVTIARALAQQGEVLLLDEPVSALDIGYQVEVLAQVVELTRTRRIAAACVLHDLNLAAQFCDSLALLEEGRIIAYGNPETVLDPARLSDLYGVPLLRLQHPNTGRILILPKYATEG